jgi:NTP pyrophosphatase (non-canonical NTP hydrolase)
MKEKILDWAKERNLLHEENHTKQYIKLVEELGELGSAILKKDEPDMVDALGDIQVVLIILAEQLGLDLEECLKVAYDEIKDRKGVTQNGTFIKNETI